MVWVLVVATGVLLALLGGLAVLTLRLRARLESVEARLVQQAATPEASAVPVSRSRPADPTEPAVEYVITAYAGPEDDAAQPTAAAPVVSAPVFADIVARETAVQAASLVHGLRRALAPETRNRIRFHVRQEVKRSRKQRRAELREVRREWAARQRAAQEPAA
jgi:hypothetical protein